MLPSWLEALILGVVQGLTEFIPVSSSGHLVLFPYAFGFSERGLAFDVMLHLGTLGAVLVYFRWELVAIARGLLGLDRTHQGRVYRRVGLLIVPASVPVGVAGLLLQDEVDALSSSPLPAALLLLVTAALLLALEQVRGRRVAAAALPAEPDVAGEAVDVPPEGRVLPLGVDLADPRGTDLARVSLRQVMVVGVMQCVALLPGVSRSGTTIAAGVFAGLTREAATRFSFLLVIPALVGASVLSIPDLAEAGGESGLDLAVGIAAAFASGYAAIRFLVALVSRERLTGFAIYCVALSAASVGLYLLNGPPA